MAPATGSDAPEREATDEDEGAYRTVVRESGRDDGLDAQRKLDRRSPGFASAVELDHEAGARPADGLPEVLARSPGVTVRSIGGLGQFSSVSLRGSSAQQVGVFLDGVPIHGGVAGLVNLGDLPLDALTRVEIYRGYVPIAFGGSTLGGAVNLVSSPGTSPRLTVDGGYGSFGARQSRVTLSVPAGRGLNVSARVGYAGAEGNFPFYDTGGTPSFTGDDTTSLRINNGYDRLLGQVRVDGRRGQWRFAAQEIVVWKHQGIPGVASAQARSVSLETFNARTIASARRIRFGGPGGRIEWLLGVGADRRAFRDPDGEVGAAINDQILSSIDTYLSPRLRLPLWQSAFLGVVADQRSEWVRVDERAGTMVTSGDATRVRLAYGAGAQIEQFAWQRRLLVVPAVRVDALDSRFAVAEGTGEQEDTGRDTVEVGYSPRVGTRLRIVPPLELRGSVGRTFRPPTLLELFGDRGYVVGNEGLRPERGTSVDGGFVIDIIGRRRTIVYGQIAGFSSWSEDLIQWAAAGPVTRPENVSDATVAGLETSVTAALWRRTLVTHANYTFLDARDRGDDPERRGVQLPGRPRHEVFGRASLGHEWLVRTVLFEPRVFYTIEFIAGTFLDPSGRLELPPRTIHGLGTEVHLVRRVHFGFEVRNLLDNRVARVSPPVANTESIPLPISDFIGYPLAGRSVWATLRIDMDLLQRQPETRRS